MAERGTDLVTFEERDPPVAATLVIYGRLQLGSRFQDSFYWFDHVAHMNIWLTMWMIAGNYSMRHDDADESPPRG